MVGAAALVLVSVALAQTETKETVAGTATVTKMKKQGEIIATGSNWLIAKMIPDGEYSLFYVDPAKQAMVDGVGTVAADLKPGTILTAEVTVTETPIVDRTTTVTQSTVYWASPKSVIVTLEDGGNKEYDVPEGFKFKVDDKELSAMDLKKGMKITATKIVEHPRATIVMESAVAGTAPK